MLRLPTLCMCPARCVRVWTRHSLRNLISGSNCLSSRQEDAALLDSCDHVVEAAASLVENLLKGAQRLNILATIDVYASLSSNSSKRANARSTNNWTAGNASASTAVNLREMSGPFSGARRCTHAPSGTRELATVRHLPQPGWDCTHDRTGGSPQAVALVLDYYRLSDAFRQPLSHLTLPYLVFWECNSVLLGKDVGIFSFPAAFYGLSRT